MTVESFQASSLEGSEVVRARLALENLLAFFVDQGHRAGVQLAAQGSSVEGHLEGLQAFLPDLGEEDILLAFDRALTDLNQQNALEVSRIIFALYKVIDPTLSGVMRGAVDRKIEALLESSDDDTLDAFVEAYQTVGLSFNEISEALRKRIIGRTKMAA